MTELYAAVEVFMSSAIPLLFAITVHEVAHGWTAHRLGDQTAWALGRITLNPFKHIDLLGTVLIPTLCIWLGGFIFGWAKPVPVDWQNLQNPRRDRVLVAMAGPLANAVMAIFWAAVAKLAWSIPEHGLWLRHMGQTGIAVNGMFMLFNLIPIPPLDGSRVILALLPKKLARAYEKGEAFGLLILLALVFFGAINIFIQQPLWFFIKLMNTLFALPYV